MKNSPPDSPPLTALISLWEFKQRYELLAEDAALFDAIRLCDDYDLDVPTFARSGIASHWRRRTEDHERKFAELFDVPDFSVSEVNRARKVKLRGASISVRAAALAMMSKRPRSEVSFEEVGDALGVSKSTISRWMYEKPEPFGDRDKIPDPPLDRDQLLKEIYEKK